MFLRKTHVAVVGAGGAGLAALRLLNHGPESIFKATAFEATTNVGGTWFYTDHVGTDGYGIPVHTSMYKNLRTNLPKETMAYPDFPFPTHLPSFMRHQDVQEYLEDYATHFNLWKDIKFKTKVNNVTPVPDENYRFGVKWEVETVDSVDPNVKDQRNFDAVLVCNGHLSEPSYPKVEGLETFEGHVIHSHDYREPKPYTNKTVLVLGAQASGQDISFELSTVSSQVYLCHRYGKMHFLPSYVHQKPGIRCIDKKRVEFTDRSVLDVDAIILCTGYKYNFSFLDESCGIRVDDGRVSPLFKHFLSIDYPSLGLVGILNGVLPFPLFHTQIKYFRSILDGTVQLPSREEMLADEKNDLAKHLARRLPKRFFHSLTDHQFSYMRQISRLGNFEALHPIIETIIKKTYEYRKTDITTYRTVNFVLSDDGEDVTVLDDLTKKGVRERKPDIIA